MPIVSMTSENAGWPRIGRMTMRSRPKPNSAITAIVAAQASQNGQPASVISAKPAKAPSIISSPCAKLTVSVVL